MAKILENVGERTIEHLDYVGSLNIQLWAALRAMGQSLPFLGNRYRWQATVRQMLEIGSGNSTKFARRAIRDHRLCTRITSIDPHPRAEIDAAHFVWNRSNRGWCSARITLPTILCPTSRAWRRSPIPRS